MLRETESKFLDSISVTSRGIVKTAASQLPGDKERVQKMLGSFEHSPDVPNDIMGKFLQRAELDLDSESVKQDFFVELKAMRQKESLHLSTAMSLRRAGIFKFAGRDVYEDLETGDFWKISEDKKHVMRLFKEDETGVADKSASKEAGKKKGPGKPDGTGPMKDSPQCPYNKKKDGDDSDDEKSPLRRRLRERKKQRFMGDDDKETEASKKVEILTKQSDASDAAVFDWLSKHKYSDLKKYNIDDIVSEINLVHEDVNESLKNIISALKNMLNE